MVELINFSAKIKKKIKNNDKLHILTYKQVIFCTPITFILAL